MPESHHSRHLVPAILMAGLAASSIATAVDPFTVVLIPDTQHYSDSSSNIIHFINQTQWVMDNRVAKNIALVAHVGDVVQNGSNLTEWNRADGAMDTLDTNPDQAYGVVLGNHDHNGGLAADNDATNYISFFGAARYVGKLWYGGDSPDGRNHHHRFQAGGRDYLHLVIEYHGASADNSNSAEVITWAQGVLDANPGIPTILSTHEYLNTGGGRSTYGNDIFNSIVKGNSQVFMVLCGHWHGEAHSVAQNDAGQDVFQILADFQTRANGGNGWLALLEFDEDNSAINVTTYSPSLMQWETDANSQYSFAMDFDARLGPIGTGPRLWSPSASAITDDGATVQCELLNADADDVTLVWAFADQGETTVGTWTAAPGGGSHSFGAASQDDVLSRVLTGLDGDTEYSFRFFATAGAESDWSAAVAFATGLGGSPAPAGFAGVAGTVVSGTKVDLSWTDSYAHETGFVIRRSTDPGFATYDEFPVGADETSYTDDTTAPNTTYYFRIAAEGGSGTGPFSANIEVATGNPGPGPVAGLIGHWKFDEGSGTTAADSSVNGYDADQVNADGSWTTGKAGGAYNQSRFTLDAAESDELNLAGTGTVTLSVWVTVHSTAQFGGIAGFEGTGTSGDIYSLKMDNADRINWTVLPSHGPIASSDTLANYAAATGDGWVHVVGVFEQGVGSTLYVNGSVAATGAAGGPIPDKTTPGLFRIGTYYNSNWYEFNGAIDDVQLYNQALTAGDVAFLFNNPGSPLTGPSSTVTMGTPSASSITNDGATVECQLLNDDADEVTLVWAHADQGETTVGTWTAAPGGGSHSFGAASQDDVLSRVLTGLSGDTVYHYRFLATAGADSDWSIAGNFATGLAAIPAPADLSGTAGTTATTTKVDLTWTDSYATETGFLIRRSTDPGFASFDEFPVGADENSYTDDTTDPNTTYYYRIAAEGSTGTGPFSSNLAVTTGDDPSGGGTVASLIGHWTFDDGSGTTAADSSVNGYDADVHLTEGTSAWIAGKAGGAYNQPRFTLDATESDALNLPGGSVTLSVWVTAHNTSQYAGIAGFEGTGSTGDIFGFKMDNADRLNWTAVGGSLQVSPDTLTNYAAATPDGWVHLVGVYDGVTGASTAYINGAPVMSATQAAGIPDKTPPGLFRIGTYYNSNSYEFNGAIDDVQLYDAALSADDVTFLFNNPGSALQEPDPTFTDWIAPFGLDPGEQDFEDDPDRDNLANGLEAWFGTHPGQFNAGLADLATDGTTTTFTHPQNENPPSDVSGFYEWSPDLSNWYAGDGVDGPGGGPTVTFVPNTAGGTTTVTATASEELERLFLRAGVMQN